MNRLHNGDNPLAADWPVRIGCILVIGLAFVHTGDSHIQNSASPEQLEQIARAESKWLANKPDAYEFRFAYACNGLIPPQPNPPMTGAQPWMFQVKGGQSTLAVDVTATVRVKMEQYETVEKQFAFIRKAWESRPRAVSVTYDKRLGYPTRVCVDPTVVMDDEFGFVITDLSATFK
jgi:Family of unknown function (DUF6174)